MRAIDIAEDAAVPEGHVAKQFRPGYVLHGAVLRPAEVGVAR
jgi:molecular chaperone GrpE (heat shock protein)